LVQRVVNALENKILKKYEFLYKNILRVLLEFRRSEEFNFLTEEISRTSLDKSL